MRKPVTALLAALTIVISLFASATDADAQRWRRGHRGHGVAAGVAAGIIGGAVLGAAIASSRPAYAGYAPVRGYVAYPNYYVAAPVGCPGGYWARRPVVNQWGHVVGYSRPRFFCPGY